MAGREAAAGTGGAMHRFLAKIYARLANHALG